MLVALAMLAAELGTTKYSKGSKGSLREGTTRMILETTNFTNLHESSFAKATDDEKSACGGIRNHEIQFFAPLYYFLDRG
jgi:hypothetical protein